LWVITREGFFSVCRRDGDRPGHLRIRARVRADFGKLAGFVDLVDVEHKPHADYKWHAQIEEGALGRYLAQAVARIDYADVKDKITRGNHARHRTYMNVWGALLAIEDEEGARGVATSKRR